MMGFYKALSPWRKTCLSVKLHLLLSLDMSLVNYWKCSTFFSDQSRKELSWTFKRDCHIVSNRIFPKAHHNFLCIYLCVFVLESKADSYGFTSVFFQRTWNLPSPVAPKSPNQAPPLQPPKRALAAAAWFHVHTVFDASEIPLTSGLGVSITVFEGFHRSEVVQEFFHRKSSHESMCSPRKVTGSIPAQKSPFTNLQ